VGFVSKRLIGLLSAIASESKILTRRDSGDSDSNGSITSNILATMLVKGAILNEWLAKLEVVEGIEKTALPLFE
jgi:hypothetical protein